MPVAKIGSLNIYYEIIGKGPPLAMIRGVGSNVDHWYEQVSALSQKFQLLIFDNRGIARSSDPGGPFTIRDMATDTIALMEAVGIEKAHVLGYSMGGMIAQEMALNHPQRIGGLVLVATDCGISRRIKARPEASRLFSEMVRLGTKEARLAAERCLFAGQTFENNPAVIRRYAEVSQRFPAAQAMLARQWAAVKQHDASQRLRLISSPTLAITGSEDVLIPPQNSALLAELIPGAHSASIDGGGHLFLIEQPRQFNEAVNGFLEQISL